MAVPVSMCSVVMQRLEEPVSTLLTDLSHRELLKHTGHVLQLTNASDDLATSIFPQRSTTLLISHRSPNQHDSRGNHHGSEYFPGIGYDP